MIALVTMLIDHIGAVLLWQVYLASFQITGSMQLSSLPGDKILVWTAQHQELVYGIYQISRYIGRMAFPIYCFLLVEGFLHTRSVAKYAMRLFLFALISEIPFDLAIAGKWWSMDHANVFFTLLLGLLLIWGLSYLMKFYEFWQEKNWDDVAGKMILLLTGGFMAITLGGFAEMVLQSDYGMAGVLAIGVIYLGTVSTALFSREIGFALAIMLLSILSSSSEILALLMIFPLRRYDGTRGKNSKYIFYVFYPAHLLLLGLLAKSIVGF